MDFEEAFNKANETVHPVETQWHYPIMTKHGYEANTKEAVGFVRCYSYTNPTTNHTMTVTTGSSADYWTDKANNAGGYWRDLEPHLVKLESK